MPNHQKWKGGGAESAHDPAAACMYAHAAGGNLPICGALELEHIAAIARELNSTYTHVLSAAQTQSEAELEQESSCGEPKIARKLD